MSRSYILIDTTLLGYPVDKPWIKRRRKPTWVAAIYGRDAIVVSPILIDVERAWHCNRIDAVMALVNATSPQLGISFIETELTLNEVLLHLRQFICIQTEEGIELTLRFADCIVLANLAVLLTSKQWSWLVAPFESWKVHSRDGKLKSLPILKVESPSRIPLLLSEIQISALRDAFGADQLLANLRKLRPEHGSEYSTMQAHQYAEQTRQIWLSAGHEENTDLLLFARHVFETQGRLLLHPGLKSVLEQSDPILRQKDLQRLASHHCGGTKR
ncbi:DUF4123 domain-containing protein [Duganella sp. FT109W]|uniref:DUF4123 domain-containing protein n=1 Tax=Duganella margarita TaxID=2692170 RepID=A0ABW9WEY4_9BURK|nr:DUF4123 domain-containing protein [Duganella margarita]MYN39642.1 DUF4123 domain-containing protein [Duganella margarita]